MAEFKETAESKELDKEGLSENESSGPSSEVQEQRTSELEQEDNDSLEGDETESESEDTSEGDESASPEQTGEAEREQPLMTETKEGNSDIGEEDTLDESRLAVARRAKHTPLTKKHNKTYKNLERKNAISPTLVKIFGQSRMFNAFWHRYLDRKVSKLKKKGYDSTPYVDKEF